MFTVWGHSALRVTDSSNRSDIVYNYGSFDFDAPGFYTKFAEGNMQYFVSTGSFGDFVYEYRYFKRGITEQELNLSCIEKLQLAAALKENAKEENKFYRYDFLFDNCSSRLRDIISKNTSPPPVFANTPGNKKLSFWNLIHENLDKYNRPWGRLGIDILLGHTMDTIANGNQAMFLPDYLMRAFDSASAGGRKLVSSKQVILAEPAIENTGSSLAPFTVFSVLLLVMVICSFSKSITRTIFFSIFDFLLFLITGLLGVLLLFLWFGRVDTSCSNNYNILWALPTHTLIAFAINKKWKWVKLYWVINSIILLLLLVAWKWLPQEMNNGLLPIVILLLLRTVMRYRKTIA